MIDWRATIISQYANSPTLVALIEYFNEWIDQSLNVEDFYNFVWNVLTAKGWGLDVWGRIVNISRTLTIPASDNLGFEEADPDSQPFGQAAFYRGEPTTQNYVLADDAFRLLILTKALSNISNCTIPVYNKLLLGLFPDRGNIFIVDAGNMQAWIVVEFEIADFEFSVLKYSNAFSFPTGVGPLQLLIAPSASTFGFNEAEAETVFGEGIFCEGLV